MLPKSLSTKATLIGVAVLQTHLAAAVSPLVSPPCAVNCTITTLSAAGCALTNVKNCFCTNMNLQLELANCVYKSCNQTEQQIATRISQEQLCVGVPFESRKSKILRVEYTLVAFTYPIIILRMISRIWVTRRVWWDDWMVVIAAAFMITNSFIPIWAAYHGFGLHIWNVEVQNTIPLTKLYYVGTIFYSLIQNLAKFSILFFYLRIFPAQRFRLLIKMAMGFMVCHTLAFTLSIIFQCIPIDTRWTSSPAGKCIDMYILAIAGAISSILEDLVILILPINQLMGLRLSRRKRIALAFMFALGSFACIASMIRLKVIIDFYPNPGVDSTWTSVDAVIWSDIETFLAIICSCLMCLRPLISKVCPKAFGTANASANTPAAANVDSDGKMKSYSKIGAGTPSKLRADKWGSSSFGTQNSKSDDGITIIQQRRTEELPLQEMPTSLSTKTNNGRSAWE